MTLFGIGGKGLTCSACGRTERQIRKLTKMKGPSDMFYACSGCGAIACLICAGEKNMGTVDPSSISVDAMYQFVSARKRGQAICPSCGEAQLGSGGIK